MIRISAGRSFAAGILTAGAVAWLLWPRPVALPPAQAAEPVTLRSSTLKLSGGGMLEVVTIPGPDGVFASQCAIYRNGPTELMQCPAHESVDLTAAQ